MYTVYCRSYTKQIEDRRYRHRLPVAVRQVRVSSWAATLRSPWARAWPKRSSRYSRSAPSPSSSPRWSASPSPSDAACRAPPSGSAPCWASIYSSSPSR